MESIRVALALALTSILPLVAMATPAAAEIRCQDSYQMVNGSLIATPFCEDSYLAHVANTYGEPVTPHAIRNNPSTKEDVCRLVGNDTRVADICAPYMDTARRGSGD